MSYLEDVIEVAQHVPVFPCRATTTVTDSGKELKRKRPHIKQFKQKATQDPVQIKRWWGKWPDALVGMPTGSPSGVFAIDFDAINGESPEEMMSQLPGDVDEFTLMQKTKRGLHVLFELDPDRPLRNGTDVFGDHIDMRGEGGYLCIAPSEGYKLIGTFDDLEPVPEWIYKYLRNRVKAERAKTGEEIQSPETVIKTLMTLNPKLYRSYEDWVRIMLACYHGSDADEAVKEAFKEWSSQDDEAYNDFTDQQIEAQWEAAATDISAIVTYKTLRHEMTKQHGAVVLDQENPFNSDDFDDIDQLEEDEEIRAVAPSIKLQANNRGKVEVSPSNLRKMLQAEALMGRDNPLYGVFQFNEMGQRVEFKKDPPWGSQLKGKPFDDVQITNMAVYLSGMYKTNFSPDSIMRGVLNAGIETHSYHPVKQYLEGLKWDGKRRIQSWLPDLVKTEDSPYNCEIGRRFLMAAVARAMDPGCQVDTMPVFEGPQGIYKTSMVKVLGGDWYRAPTLRDLSSKESVLTCIGAWFIEVEEMGAIRSNQIDYIKKFVTNRDDSVRFPYDKFTTDVPRSFVLVGTMNPSGDNQYIHDVTGARRFWPIELRQKIDIKALEDIRDQLFAEAMVEYQKGDPWWFTDEEDRDLLITEAQRQRQSEDPFFEPIYDYLYEGQGSEAPTITPSEIWVEALGGHKTLTNNREANRIKRILVNSLRWEYKSSNIDSSGRRSTSRRRYCRPEWEYIFE